MDANSKYTCSVCGEDHSEWPALTWPSPTPYNELSEEDKGRIGKLDSDFCVIAHQDQTDRFIRCTLHQRVIDHGGELDYGVWVSLSEKSFNDYVEHYNDNDHEGQYFGWLCNNIPPYGGTLSIPTTVRPRPNGQRPYVIPHEDHDHPFVHDFYNGISMEEAIRRVHESMGLSPATGQGDHER